MRCSFRVVVLLPSLALFMGCRGSAPVPRNTALPASEKDTSLPGVACGCSIGWSVLAVTPWSFSTVAPASAWTTSPTTSRRWRSATRCCSMTSPIYD